MKRTSWIFLLAMLSIGPLQADNKRPIEVGIEEKLGQTIPLDLKFVTEHNDTVALAQLINKPTILSLVYFDCPSICSPMLNGLSSTVEKLDMKLGETYQIITISFNTKDTPEKAAEKKKNFVTKISKDNQHAWFYLTGDQASIDAITDAVGWRYKAQGMDFAHAAAIMVLSPDGKITRYLYGIDYLPFDLKMAIIEAQKGQPRPSINKILEICFAYDPAAKTYTLQVTRIVGALSILIALIAFGALLLVGRKKNQKKTV